jgi:hypothetical protein
MRNGADDGSIHYLLKSGKFRERFIMKRKEESVRKQPVHETEHSETPAEAKSNVKDTRIFLLEDGKLKAFSPEDYTASTLYEVVESYSVECRLVRPEDPGTLVFEGKKPSKKTVPIIVSKDGDCILLESWERLESSPEQLTDALEVIGASPVKQAFVLRRK